MANEILPFGLGAESNVMTQAEYEALAARSGGFSSGVAKSEQLNKVWRQSSFIASVLADFIATQSGDDVLDNGNTAALLASLEQAIKKYANSNLPIASTSKQGITQLSSLTNSSSETLAATLKAVKTVSDAGLKVTGNLAEIKAAGPAAVAEAQANLNLAELLGDVLQKKNNLSEIAAAGSAAQSAAQANIGLPPSKFSGRLMGVPRVITSSGTYTATAGTTFVIVEQIGGGGASGNIPATNASQYSITTPASMGAYAKAYFGSGFNGVSCIIGAGAAGSSSAGGKGGDTSFGSLLVCPGGPGSQSGAIGALPVVTGGPSGPTTPTISGGTLMESSYGQLTPPAACVASGVFLNYVNTDRSLLGNAGVGGSGYYNSVSSSAKVGINGNDGIIIVWEFS